jgi:hypothetical protein
LKETLQSVSLQSLPCVAIVIVHGAVEVFELVREVFPETSLLHVVHAPNDDVSRLRGYPLNVGIEHCLSKLPLVQYLLLLDDDDIVYPFFTRVMTDAFAASEADLVYAGTNRREAGKPLAPFFPIQPYYHLLDQNFISSNGYAVSTAALRRCGVRFAEDLDSLEDWFFLLQLLEKGLRFHSIETTLSEFRVISEIEFAARYDLALWRANDRRIRRYINNTAFPIPGSDLARLSESHPEQTANDDRFADSSVASTLRRRVWALENSFSWKCTAPVRFLAGGILRMRSRLKVRV